MRSPHSMCGVSRRDGCRNNNVRERCSLKEDVVTRAQKAYNKRNKQSGSRLCNQPQACPHSKIAITAADLPIAARERHCSALKTEGQAVLVLLTSILKAATDHHQWTCLSNVID
ncbi:hypothetical protein EVAR_24706_1 [Eumeta japonica]|uniref:Uncharacterized protein n=1 Tax=Eumeta variegata TaxID=151549 RepID=A0A4C1VFH1_EUMVA|nr:hypothetical protein EVAR_24706_1 [Eumeta japonica]